MEGLPQELHRSARGAARCHFLAIANEFLTFYFRRCSRAKEFAFGTENAEFVTLLTNKRDGGHALLTSLSLIAGQADLDRLPLSGERHFRS